MRVLLLSKYDVSGSSSRVRFYQYIPYLKKEGIDVDRMPLLNDSYINNIYRGIKISPAEIAFHYLKRLYILTRVARYDLIWIEKEIFPYLPSFIEKIFWWLRIPYAVDYDDATFLQYSDNENYLIRKMLRNKISRVMRYANVVIAGNKYLGENAKISGAKHVEILPSVVDAKRYYCQNTHENARITIGWIGSPQTAKYLGEVAGPLKYISKNENVSIIIIGIDYNQVKDLESIRYPWTEDTEVSLINKIDIGIMPLSHGPWEKGKCGYKLIQYMACKKAVVASPVGVNKEIVRDGVNGILADNSEEWTRALKLLCNDVQLRISMGREGRKVIEQEYCIQVTTPKLVNIFNSVKKI